MLVSLNLPLRAPVVSSFVLLGFVLAVQTAAAQGGARPRPVATAHRVAEGPTLDGDVVEDMVWQQAQATEGFWQITPDDGQAGSERTEVRILYSATTLYIGVVCHDRSPQSIVAADSRRDSSLDNTDSFRIILDTFRDGQSGFVFGTNPAGIEYDGQVTSEGQGGGFGGRGGGRNQQAGSGGGFNLNWDGAWEVRTKVGDFGWSAEFAIPFKTLRYRPSDTSWKVNFQRNVQRRNERAFWASLDRQYNLYRLVDAGTLSGLTVPPQRNLKFSPFVTAATIDQAESAEKGDFALGADAKWSISPSMTLDLTVNTDFAQVEVDEEQINLNRFNLFFPEKRPFFLENAGLFSVGNPGAVEMFFSRRIGIDSSGAVIPIRGGGRLTGKSGDVNIGLLNMQTRHVTDVVPRTNFTVARIARDLPNRSSVGAIFTNRVGTGSFAEDDDHGQTYALDARFGIGRRGSVSGYAARTQTPGFSGRQHAANFGTNYNSPGLRAGAQYTEVGEAFNPQAGFLSRSGYRRIGLNVFRTIRLTENKFGFLELRPHTNYRGFWNFEGFQETGYWHIDNHWVWRSGNQISTAVNVTHEGVVTPFEIYPGVIVPTGTYDHAEAEIIANTNRAAPAYVRFVMRTGGFFGGSRVSPTLSSTVRMGDAFNVNVSYSRNDVDLPWGDFVTNLMRTRVSLSFTPRLYVQALLQYNDQSEIWSTNLRFGWLQSSNTGLFVVYNDTQDLDDLPAERFGRSFVVKYSHLLDVLR